MLAATLSTLLLLAPATQAAAAPDDFQAALALGLERLRYGDLESAREIFEQALARDPKDRRRHMMLAAVFREEDPPRLDRFEERARLAWEVDPASPLPMLRLALALRDEGQLDRAEAVAQEALAAFPEEPQLLRALGTIRLRRGETGPAVRLLQKAAELAPDDPEIGRDLGLAVAEAGHPGRALLGLQEARQRWPTDLEVRRALAKIYRQIDDEAHAVAEEEAVRQIETLEERAAERRRNLRALSRRIRELEETAASASPPRGTFTELWELCVRRGDVGWTLPRLERLAVAAGDLPEARSLLGLVQAARGDREAAGATLQAVLQQQPAEPLALHALTRLHAVGETSVALKAAAERAVGAAPDSPAAHLALGVALLGEGAREEAAEALRRAIELEPDGPRAHLRLARILQLDGRRDEAAALLEQAARRFPEAPGVPLSRGLFALAAGDQQAAAEHLARAQDLGGHDPRLFRSLGDLAAGRGEPLEAAGYYKLSLAADPDQPDLREFIASAG